MQIHSYSEYDHSPPRRYEHGLQRVLDRLIKTSQRNSLVRKTLHELRESLEVDRVVLYYFYGKWHGQVTCESLSDDVYSILGSTGGDDCFSEEYASLYLAGRVRAIADIELEAIHSCHRNFLRSLQVRANLAVPVVIARGLWGLLVAHHCQSPRPWSSLDIEQMQTAAQTLATDPCILET